MNAITRQYLSDRYELHGIDWRDSIDAGLMAECLKTNDASPIWDRIDPDGICACEDELESVRIRMTEDGLGHVFDEDEDGIREWIETHDESNPVRDLCRNSRYCARILQHSNHECWIPPYDAGTITYDGAFKEAVDMLALNPAEVKRELSRWADCEGRWPNRPKRNPVVSAKDFSKCCLNMNCYGVWGFFGSVRGGFLYDNGFSICDGDVIPKGTFCGWCNTWNGGGTLEPIYTLREVSVRELTRNLHSDSKYTRIGFELDEKGACGGYSILPEVYGDSVDAELLRA